MTKQPMTKQLTIRLLMTLVQMVKMTVVTMPMEEMVARSQL